MIDRFLGLYIFNVPVGAGAREMWLSYPPQGASPTTIAVSEQRGFKPSCDLSSLPDSFYKISSDLETLDPRLLLFRAQP